MYLDQGTSDQDGQLTMSELISSPEEQYLLILLQHKCILQLAGTDTILMNDYTVLKQSGKSSYLQWTELLN